MAESQGRASLRAELEKAKGSRSKQSDPEAAKARNIAMAKAAALATSVLKSRHKQEYDTLYQQAKTEMGLD